MEKATQDKNILRIDTPLGKDVLHITRAEIHEGISTLFSIQAFVYTNGQYIKAQDIVGKSVTVSIQCNIQGVLSCRYFNGYVSSIRSTGSRVSAVAGGEKYQDYVISISPCLAFLSQRSNCRIFQKLNAEDIVKTILAEHNVIIKSELINSYPVYDYKVQYNESDLDFVSRLLEHEGIYFFFRHDMNSHQMVLADDITSYKECAEALVSFSTGSLSEPHIHTWSDGLEVTPNSSVKSGYDFVMPADKPFGEQVEVPSYVQPVKTEIFEYQAGSEFNHRAKDVANTTLDALQRDSKLSSGSSNCLSFTAGQYFTIKSHEDTRNEGKSFVITQMNIEVAIASQTGTAKHTEQVFRNYFSCVSKETLYRPLQLTAKPRVHGVQTACVTGEDGDEIYIDKYGRVKVLFHWDRDGEADSTSSCWIRVAQNWAGNKYGAFFFPRVGQEVLVEFFEGDPDQPIIIGSLYNGEKMPPYDLPNEKTQSGIKTRSTKEANDDNFNEIRFDDEKGNELLYIHAEKDFHTVVENDLHQIIENNYSVLVENNSQKTVENNYELTVENNYNQIVENNLSSNVENNQKTKVGNELVIDVGNKMVFKSGGASITLSSDGCVEIKGSKIKVNGSTIDLKAGSIALN
ncbi:type VI secretion system tip protein VgrG [Photobacterium makurazakiensis]|uniref:type VI secretion system Vgr family protein n=1 Tax=Photobacterium makurazakiensis TaxID=2910234 RepID=UPI003D0BC85E